MKNKVAILGMITFLYYYLFNLLNTLPVYLVGIDFNTLSLTTRIIYLISVEVLFILSLFYINKELFPQLKEFIKNIKSLITQYFKYWPLAYGLMITSNLILVLIMPGNSPNNQEAIYQTLETAPIYMVVSAVIFAPIVEEIVFRLGFRKMFSNDKLFIILSGLVFGAFHVVGSFDSLIDLLFVIPYSIPGCVFAYTLVKSKNIFVPITLHFFHNFFMMAVQLVLLSFI